MISFIMMAKDVQNYINDAIVELQKENKVDWELIIVDDHSSDATFEVANDFAKIDGRVKVVKNRYNGKVLGTNYGYSLSKGEIIKCIDSDDVLLRDFFRHYDEMKKYDAHCHSIYITDERLQRLSTYNSNPLILSQSYEFALSNLLSIPKCSWSFKRSLAEKIFPLPDSLPFEDVWISLLIKKNASSIRNINQPLYLYRQHSNQTFGGIINYSSDKVIFRAKRLLRLVDVLEIEPRATEGFEKDIFDNTRVYNTLMSKEKLFIWDVLKCQLRFVAKVKIILIKKFPILAKYITVLKWKLDATNKN